MAIGSIQVEGVDLRGNCNLPAELAVDDGGASDRPKLPVPPPRLEPRGRPRFVPRG